jgi:hypothetical protein
MNLEEQQEQEQEDAMLYEEALRDPLDEDEEEDEPIPRTECEDDGCEDPDYSGHCIICGKDLCKPYL